MSSPKAKGTKEEDDESEYDSEEEESVDDDSDEEVAEESEDDDEESEAGEEESDDDDEGETEAEGEREGEESEDGEEEEDSEDESEEESEDESEDDDGEEIEENEDGQVTSKDEESGNNGNLKPEVEVKVEETVNSDEIEEKENDIVEEGIKDKGKPESKSSHLESTPQSKPAEIEKENKPVEVLSQSKEEKNEESNLIKKETEKSSEEKEEEVILNPTKEAERDEENSNLKEEQNEESKDEKDKKSFWQMTSESFRWKNGIGKFSGEKEEKLTNETEKDEENSNLKDEKNGESKVEKEKKSLWQMTSESFRWKNGMEKSTGEKEEVASKPTKEEDTGEEDSNPKSKKDGEPTVEDVRNAFHDSKVDKDKKSIWKLTSESFRWRSGNKPQSETINFSVDDCVTSLKTMLSDVEDSDPKWKFTLTPLEPLNATTDDLLRAFAMWSRKEEDGNTVFNATKAFARLGGYASWMEEHRSYFEEPLTLESIKEAADSWKIKMTHGEKNGNLICWLDVGALDLNEIKKSGHHASGETLRYLVWLCHVAMFDRKGQENGMIVVESIGYTGTMKSLTIIPSALSKKLDHLTIGVLPIRLNGFYIMKYQRWLSVMVGMMKPFLSQKMRQRITMIPLKANLQEYFDDLVGQDSIPVGFGGLEGKVEKDIVFDK